MIRNLIFDLDGTLVDSCAICVDILSEMLVERGSSNAIDPIDARACMSRGGVDMVRTLLGNECSDADADLRDFRARYELRRTPAQAVYPGVASGLRRLRNEGVLLAICSNKPQNLCEKVLADTGLATLFDAVVGGRPGLGAKPAPDLLLAVLAEAGCAASECLFVGDSELDHQIARDVGMQFVFMTYGYAARGWQPTDCRSFGHFGQMVEALLDDLISAHA